MPPTSRTAGHGLAALALGLLLLGPAATPEAAAAPRFRLEVKAAKDEVRLGDTIELRVTLRSGYPKAVEAAPLRIASPSGLVFFVKAGGKTHQVARLFGKYSGKEFREGAVSYEELKPGKAMTQVVEIPAVRTGDLEITTVYTGFRPSTIPDPVEAKPLTITVKPGPNGGTRMGARIRTDLGNMVVELDPDRAFNTVVNFHHLASTGFYEKRVFHRIWKDFMVQTGCPNGNGTGGPGYYLPAEFNDRKHEPGVLSMARETHDNTAGSQFFLMHGTNTGLDWKYTGFGRVIEGMDVLEKIATVPVQKAPNGEMSDPVVKPALLGVEMVLLPPAEPAKKE